MSFAFRHERERACGNEDEAGQEPFPGCVKASPRRAGQPVEGGEPLRAMWRELDKFTEVWLAGAVAFIGQDNEKQNTAVPHEDIQTTGLTVGIILDIGEREKDRRAAPERASVYCGAAGSC